ncbi:MAG: rRNA maturation RNase YbeY [Chitinophagaceae bacterium]|jgi:rRNA maturation RNase YbeY
MNEVQFFFLQPVSVLKQRNKLKSFLQKTAQKEGRPISSLNIIFCSDDYLLNINKQFLNHDFYTDIITFDLSESKKGPVTAELYISYDRVKDNARQMKTVTTKELHRVVFHGLLHLLGYKDKSTKDKMLMRKMEDKLLVKYFR